jgi:hypothetical protein
MVWLRWPDQRLTEAGEWPQWGRLPVIPAEPGPTPRRGSGVPGRLRWRDVTGVMQQGSSPDDHQARHHGHQQRP